jgi:hypothetical protein
MFQWPAHYSVYSSSLRSAIRVGHHCALEVDMDYALRLSRTRLDYSGVKSYDGTLANAKRRKCIFFIHRLSTTTAGHFCPEPISRLRRMYVSE